MIPQSGRFSNPDANLFQFNRKNSRNVPQNLEPRVDVGVVGVHQHCPGPANCGENQEVSPGVLLDDCSVLIVIIFRGIIDCTSNARILTVSFTEPNDALKFTSFAYVFFNSIQKHDPYYLLH